MSDQSPFSNLVPGFDFLQTLVKNAGSALPGIGQWVAPTIDPEELEKRIKELRTVEFWLEQNVRMLGATIQAMEVQRMTLSTLKTMNVQMGDLRDSLQIKVPVMPTMPGTSTSKPATEPEPAAPPAAAGVVDPLQWWGALTKQFTELATSAMKDTGADAMMKQTFDAAKDTSGTPTGEAASNAKSDPKPKSTTTRKPGTSR